MDTFVIFWSGMSDSLDGLHLHCFIPSFKVKMQELVFILSLFIKVLVQFLFIG